LTNIGLIFLQLEWLIWIHPSFILPSSSKCRRDLSEANLTSNCHRSSTMARLEPLGGWLR